ncbi:NUDIX hydrolase [Cryomorphaceae bacterium]|nr:NUDIX hydrolase [Cryomorphaceae bacterium]
MNKPDFHFAISSSIVIFSFDGSQLLFLVARKNSEPFSGATMLPSTYVGSSESLDEIAGELVENIFHLKDYYLEQLNAFGKVYRHPEGRIINVAHFALVNWSEVQSQELDEGYRWVTRDHIPQMAFDHNEIIEFALERLKRRVRHRPLGFHMLPSEFTLKEIRLLYEEVLQRELDKRNFQKKFTRSELLLPIDKKVIAAPGNKKPSQLYSFDEQQYQRLTLKGYDFKF